MKKLVFASVALLLLACNNKIDSKFIESNLWAFEDGSMVVEGDMISFSKINPRYHVKGDTLYYMGNPKAIVKKIYDRGYHMVIVSLDGKNEAVYRNVNDF